MIRLERVTKAFGASLVLDDVSLQVPRGAFVALLGPSGSGKSTLLRIVAGLDFADSGALFLDGRPAEPLRPNERGVGFVFQNYALFQHMTVAANIAFGLDVRRPRLRRADIRAAVERLLALVQLQGLGERLPSQLSGGQRQRVALARSLAVEPRILLLDEPFGALDHDVRAELRTQLRRLHDTLGMTTLFVTHDQEEAAALSDWTVRLAQGRLVGRPPPAERSAGSFQPGDCAADAGRD